MKHYDPSTLSPIFRRPVTGRLLLIGSAIIFPLLMVTFVIWGERDNLLSEWSEVAKAGFLPWVKEKHRGD